MSSPRRLLVGVAEADTPDEPRQYLIDLLQGLRELGVEIQVAHFADGPFAEALSAVAEVHRMPRLRRRSPAGLAQSAARRVNDDWAERMHERRAASIQRWLRPPDCIHLHSPQAAPLLRYLPDVDVPVTTYVHPWEFDAAGLTAANRDRLLARTHRFLTADESVVADLLALGAAPERIEPASQPVVFPPPPVAPEVRRRAREARGLPIDEMVVAIPQAPDWLEPPDLTLPLAWAVERGAGTNPPLVLCLGAPADAERRWQIDYDLARMGVTRLHQFDDDPEWDELLDLADVVVLSLDSALALPEGFAAVAADRRLPILCWEGDPHAAEVAAWGNPVVPWGDVSAMAGLVVDATTSSEGWARAVEPSWRRLVADVERIAPLQVPPR